MKNKILLLVVALIVVYLAAYPVFFSYTKLYAVGYNENNYTMEYNDGQYCKVYLVDNYVVPYKEWVDKSIENYNCRRFIYLIYIPLHKCNVALADIPPPSKMYHNGKGTTVFK